MIWPSRGPGSSVMSAPSHRLEAGTALGLGDLHRVGLERVVAGEPHQTQCCKIALPERAHRCKRLGSRSEVDRFRVLSRERLLVVGFAAGKAAQLLDELAADAAVCGIDAHVDGSLDPLALELEGLAFGPLEQIHEVHGSEAYSEVVAVAMLPSLNWRRIKTTAIAARRAMWGSASAPVVH